MSEYFKIVIQEKKTVLNTLNEQVETWIDFLKIGAKVFYKTNKVVVKDDILEVSNEVNFGIRETIKSKSILVGEFRIIFELNTYTIKSIIKEGFYIKITGSKNE